MIVSDKKDMDMSPDVEQLTSLQRAKLGWFPAIGELIDNSLDAGAMKIELEWKATRGEKEFIIRDNGRGVEQPDLMFKQGSHQKHPTTRVGMYGVGLKHAAAWMWGVVRVKTIHGGMQATLGVDWEHQLKIGSWSSKPPRYIPTSMPSGTIIRFSGIDRKVDSYRELIDFIGYTFAPAIRGGVNIIVRYPKNSDGHTCNAWELPPCTDVVSKEFEVDGKTVRLVAGLVREGEPNDHFGFNVYFAHRFLFNTDGGFGERSGVSRVCGAVELVDGWRLGTNKTELANTSDLHRLNESIAAHCSSLFDKAAAISEHLCNSALTRELNEMMQETLGILKKEKRDSTKEQSGTVSPADSGKQRRRASKTQDADGGIIAKVKERGLIIEWAPVHGNLMGYLNYEGNRLFLNQDHNLLAAWKRDGNSKAIHAICLSLVAAEHVERLASGQILLPCMADYTQFGPAISQLCQRHYDRMEKQADERRETASAC
jgi:hypothetical protein